MTQMIIFIHSLGSLWQQKTLSAGATKVWNTTGIADGPRIRSCAKVFGQVSFSAKARTELNKLGEITGTRWIASEPAEGNGSRKLKLLCPASGNAFADWYLVTVTEGLVGQFHLDSWDAANAVLLSFSARKPRQEAMFLMRPFAWIHGSIASAVLSPNSRSCGWTVTKW